MIYNPQDIFKHLILSQPQFFKTSWDCMKTIFLSQDERFVLTDDFKICLVTDEPISVHIDRTSLQFYKKAVQSTAFASNYGHKNIHQKAIIDLEFQTLIYDFIDERIDDIVKMKQPYCEAFEPSVKDLQLISSTSLLFKIDNQLDSDWITYATITAGNIKHILWSNYGIHTAQSAVTDPASWVQHHYFETFIKMNDIIKKITGKDE